jgi:hypothetical protein
VNSVPKCFVILYFLLTAETVYFNREALSLNEPMWQFDFLTSEVCQFSSSSKCWEILNIWKSRKYSDLAQNSAITQINLEEHICFLKKVLHLLYIFYWIFERISSSLMWKPVSSRWLAANEEMRPFAWNKNPMNFLVFFQLLVH